MRLDAGEHVCGAPARTRVVLGEVVARVSFCLLVPSGDTRRAFPEPPVEPSSDQSSAGSGPKSTLSIDTDCVVCSR